MNIDLCLKHGLSIEACYTVVKFLLLRNGNDNVILLRLQQLANLGHEEAAWFAGILQKHSNEIEIKFEWFLEEEEEEQSGRAYYFAFLFSGSNNMIYLQSAVEMGYTQATVKWVSMFRGENDDDNAILQQAVEANCTYAYVAALGTNYLPELSNVGGHAVRLFWMYKAAQGGFLRPMISLSQETRVSNPELSIYWLVAVILCDYYDYFNHAQIIVDQYSAQCDYLLGKYEWLYNLSGLPFFSCADPIGLVIRKLERTKTYFLQRKTKAQSQVFAWLLCAKRVGLMRDVALLIARQIWESRTEGLNEY